MIKKLLFVVLIALPLSDSYCGDFTITEIIELLSENKANLDAALSKKGFVYKGVEETAYGENYIWEGTYNSNKCSFFAIKMSPSDSSFVSVGVNYIANEQELISYKNKLESDWSNLQYITETGKIEAYYKKEKDIVSLMQYSDEDGKIHFILSSVSQEFYSMSFPEE